MQASDFTAERALAILRERNVDLQEFAAKPVVFERTCKTVYKALPLPVRLAVGRDRVERVLGAARDLYLAQSTPAASDPGETGRSVAAVVDRPAESVEAAAVQDVQPSSGAPPDSAAPPTEDPDAAAPSSPGASSVGSDDPVLAFLAEYKETNDSGLLLAAFSAAQNALSQTSSADPSYPQRLSSAAQAFYTLFEFAGNFAALDGAAELLGRLRKTPTGQELSLPVRFAVQHEEWGDTFVVRDVGDASWSILHPDGRVSYLQKDWSQWTGEGWPMGWTIETPDQQTLSFDEGHFGDGWRIVDTQLSSELDSANDPEEPQQLEGFVTIGQARYSFTATAAGFSYQPGDGGAHTTVPASRITVVRVMPMGDNQTFVMFADGDDSDNVFLSMSFWGDNSLDRAANVGFLLGARVLKAE